MMAVDCLSKQDLTLLCLLGGHTLLHNAEMINVLYCCSHVCSMKRMTDSEAILCALSASLVRLVVFFVWLCLNVTLCHLNPTCTL